MNQFNKRSQICGMYFLPISGAQIYNVPGSNIIKVRGEWVNLAISSGDFKEKDELGGIVEQELKAIVTDTGEDKAALIRDLIMNEGLVLIQMTNGSRRVVGTEQFPVALSSECGGSPMTQTLSFKRDSPEPAKILKSF
ncbi:hypothetical protein AAE250_16215 [Bacteroides sp. GD17]|jgi:hypothetical protein|uniref:hypothetical protein n=1 Tax=Bacteroides sp. GD17 TaxID=3139826 RepID=UPI00206D403C|nr:hypothetical protein [uncultured Bacteroides sp.]DAV67231.1 MAG TPA: hypothetical protein [Caudoviricetes sp.]